MIDQQQSFNLHYFAILREQRGLDREQLRSTARTARTLYDELAKQHRFTLPVERVGVAINNQFCSMDQALVEGDSVTFIPPVAGG